MEILKKINWEELVYEYGLHGKRLLPWDGLNVPFGGAYCVVDSHTSTQPHVNEPLGEEELFIGISGQARVWLDQQYFDIKKGDSLFVPAGVTHYVENNSDDKFHLYALWWNIETAANFLSHSDKRGRRDL